MLTAHIYQQFFHTPEFQNKWQTYLDAFGDDLDDLFGDDFKTKVQFAEGLQLLLDGKLSEAYYAHIRHYEDACETEADRRVFHRLVKLCYNEEEMSSIREGDWVKRALGTDDFLYYRVEKRAPHEVILKNIFGFGLTYCRTDPRQPYFDMEVTDLKTYQALTAEETARVQAFLAAHPEEVEMARRQTDRMLAYREALLNSGMREASWAPFRFYRYTTEKTAFAVNLRDCGSHILVVFGITTVIDEEHLTQWSEDNDNIKLRHFVSIHGEEDQDEAKRAVQAIYEQYENITKDDVLALKKARQKAFLARIHARLKPLGFSKKASKWTKHLGHDFTLEFEAQKSAYSDVYYFNISVYPTSASYPYCYAKRVHAQDVHAAEGQIINWQLLSEDAFSSLMDAVENTLLSIQSYAQAPLEHEQAIRELCTCDRHKCEICRLDEVLWKLRNPRDETP